MEDLSAFPKRKDPYAGRTAPGRQVKELFDLREYLDSVNAPVTFEGQTLTLQERVSWFVEAAALQHQEDPSKLNRIQHLSHVVVQSMLKNQNAKRTKALSTGGPLKVFKIPEGKRDGSGPPEWGLSAGPGGGKMDGGGKVTGPLKRKRFSSAFDA